MTVPSEAVEAAAAAVPFVNRDAVRRAVEAAAPLIAGAAERDRTFVLVWRDERNGEICRSTPLKAGTMRIGIPLDAQHADLLDAP